MSKNTSITLSPHFESFIAEQIKSGRYSSVSDVVRAGLRILENTETKLGTLRNMNEAGFFLSLWQAGLAEYDEMEGISWKWQSIDGTTVKAPLAQETVGRNPTDRGKKGSKRHLPVDGRGVPQLLSFPAKSENSTELAREEFIL